MLKCKKCSSVSYVKCVYIPGLQRYKCRECGGCQFTPTKRRGGSKHLAVVLYAHCGMSMLGIAKIFKVSDVAVLKWIRAFSEAISMPTETTEVIQIDEMWYLVNGKKTLYGSGWASMGYRIVLSDGNWVAVMMSASKGLFKKSMMENDLCNR